MVDKVLKLRVNCPHMHCESDIQCLGSSCGRFLKWKNRVILIEQCVVLQFYRNSAMTFLGMYRELVLIEQCMVLHFYRISVNDFSWNVQRAGFDRTVHGLTFL